MSEPQPQKPNQQPGEQPQRRSSLPFAVIFLVLLAVLAIKGSEQSSRDISEDAFLFELYTGGVLEVSAEDQTTFSGKLRRADGSGLTTPFQVTVDNTGSMHEKVRALQAKAQKLDPKPLRLTEVEDRVGNSSLRPLKAYALTIRQLSLPGDKESPPVQRERLFLDYLDQEGSHYAEVIGQTGKTIDVQAAYSLLHGVGSEMEFLHFDAVNSLETKKAGSFSMFMFTFGPVLLFILVIWWFMSRQMKGQGQGLLSFGRSRAVVYNTENKTGITFAHVAGIDEAKEEVSEIIEFLRNPDKFRRLGGRIPRGVLLVGAPGTGKTLLAKAIAGEADVPFISISGSDFVEMFVGVGASRVRDLFEQARKAAPCIIFLDEIDAVGRKRGSGMGGGNDEREQTLNAILVEMDGFGTDTTIIVIAATNRPDVLDAALLRPGRFDREIMVDLPDVKGREEILKVHSIAVKLAPEVDLSILARGTPGFSGAELAALVNEAAIIAAMREHAYVRQEDLEEARDKVRFGRQKKSQVMDADDKRITAYHEAGHAVVNSFMEHSDPVHKITIIPRGMALGATMMLPEKDRMHWSRNRLLDLICELYGGRVAEELFCDDITTGASNDIERATQMARRMITHWGMSSNLGAVNFGQRVGNDFLGNEYGMGTDHSNTTQRKIDEEVSEILEQQLLRARGILEKQRDLMERVAQALLKYETVSKEDFKKLVEGCAIEDLRPPTTGATPPPLPAVEAPPQAATESDPSGQVAPPPAPPSPPLPPTPPRPEGGPA